MRTFVAGALAALAFAATVHGEARAEHGVLSHGNESVSVNFPCKPNTHKKEADGTMIGCETKSGAFILGVVPIPLGADQWEMAGDKMLDEMIASARQNDAIKFTQHEGTRHLGRPSRRHAEIDPSDNTETNALNIVTKNGLVTVIVVSAPGDIAAQRETFMKSLAITE